MCDVLQRLVEWASKDKAHAVTIRIDDGYGATCWQVTLWIRGSKRVECHEVNFASAGKGREAIQSPDPKVIPVIVNYSWWEGDDEITTRLDGSIVTDDDDPFPGLEATIHAAIDAAERAEAEMLASV